jgi:phosphoglycolate phosphatase
MLAPRYHHIIWDWNGTLLDDAWLSVATVNHLLTEDSLPTISESRYAEVFGWPLPDYYKALGFQNVEARWEEFCQRFYGYYRPRERNCALRQGAKSILQEFQNQGLTQSVLSAYEHDPLNQLILDLGLRSFFQDILGIESNLDLGKISRGKRWFAQTAHIPREVLMVGDTTHDAEVAATLGVDCILVASGHQTPNRLRQEGGGVPVVESLQELHTMISDPLGKDTPA